MVSSHVRLSFWRLPKERLENHMNRSSVLIAAALALLGAAPSPALGEPAPAEPAPVSSEQQQQTINAVIARGLAQRGQPYVYGGGNAQGPTGNPDGTNVTGFDASGLMVYSFAGAGIKLPRSSGDQYQAGRQIPASQAQRGDLLFYGPDGKDSVALYLGSGWMLEATNPVVTVSPVRADTIAPYAVRVIE
jgi:cell wall-associated NlpC family hydrolase